MAKAKFEVRPEHSWQSEHLANRESDMNKDQSEKYPIADGGYRRPSLFAVLVFAVLTI